MIFESDKNAIAMCQLFTGAFSLGLKIQVVAMQAFKGSDIWRDNERAYAFHKMCNSRDFLKGVIISEK